MMSIKKELGAAYNTSSVVGWDEMMRGGAEGRGRRNRAFMVPLWWQKMYSEN